MLFLCALAISVKAQSSTSFDGNIETNGYLKECSIKARKETVKNFAK